MALFNAKRRRIIYTLVPSSLLHVGRLFFWLVPFTVSSCPGRMTLMRSRPLRFKRQNTRKRWNMCCCHVRRERRLQALRYGLMVSAGLNVPLDFLWTRLCYPSRTTRWKEAIPMTKSGKVTARGMFVFDAWRSRW